jgi:hypothetical protein
LATQCSQITKITLAQINALFLATFTDSLAAVQPIAGGKWKQLSFRFSTALVLGDTATHPKHRP